jgi:hypothetical protein
MVFKEFIQIFIIWNPVNNIDTFLNMVRVNLLLNIEIIKQNDCERLCHQEGQRGEDNQQRMDRVLYPCKQEVSVLNSDPMILC